MTKTLGGHVPSQDAQKNPKSAYRLPMLPSNAPQIIAANTVNVEDPARILVFEQDERERKFHHLVRRYGLYCEESSDHIHFTY